MAFCINLLDQPTSSFETQGRAKEGVIRIGSYEERFVASFDYWDAQAYRRHWEVALNRIVETSATSALITSMYDPAVANFIYWWPMYRVGNIVYLQNHILILKKLAIPFDADDPFSFVPDRVVINENGEQVSEWSAPIADFQSFLSSPFR